jgi:phenylpropionate dioxygenase-like ring-hydroxylating dioxygenase large terminal subunit
MAANNAYEETFIRDCWYVAALADDVDRNLQRRVLLEEPVVLYRNLAGEAVALYDACSHRKFPLSMGKLVGDVVQCGYHGWEYDCAGKCVNIPTSEKIPANTDLKSYPVTERYGLIWIWMGEKAKADPNLIPDCSHLRSVANGKIDMQCHYQLMVENLLDLSHVTFVHSSYQGHTHLASVLPKTETQGKVVVMTRSMTGAETPPLWHKVMGLPLGAPMDHNQRLEFHAPGSAFVKQSVYPSGERHRSYGFSTNHFLTPSTPKSTQYIWLISLDWPNVDPEILETFRKGVVAIIEQDRIAVEGQQVNLDLLRNKPFDPPQRSVPFDRTALASRQVIRRMASPEPQGVQAAE